MVEVRARRSSNVDVEERDNLDNLEVEYAKFQRQYKILEAERKDLLDSTRSILGKQQESIKELLYDNSEKSKDIRQLEIRFGKNLQSLTNIRSSSAHSKVSSGSKLPRRPLQDELLNEDYTEHVNGARKELEEAELNLRDAQRQLTDQRHIVGGAYAGSDNQSNIQKQIITLENRLDQTRTKFNRILTDNRRKREDIDMARREQELYEAMVHRVEREYSELKRRVADCIDTTRAAYEGRDDASNKIQVLKERNERDLFNHHQEVKELERILEQDRKLHDFMWTKDRQIRPELIETGSYKGDGSVKDRLPAETKKFENIKDVLAYFTESFERLRTHSQKANIMDIINDFIAMEDKNFSAYNFVNEMNSTLEELNYDKHNLQVEINSINDSRADVAQQQAHELKRVERNLERLKSESDELGQTKKTRLDTLTLIADGITHLLKEMNLSMSSDAIRHQEARELGDSHQQHDDLHLLTLNERTIVALSVLEEKANELLQSDYIFSGSPALDGQQAKSTTSPGGSELDKDARKANAASSLPSGDASSAQAASTSLVKDENGKDDGHQGNSRKGPVDMHANMRMLLSQLPSLKIDKVQDASTEDDKPLTKEEFTARYYRQHASETQIK